MARRRVRIGSTRRTTRSTASAGPSSARKKAEEGIKLNLESDEAKRALKNFNKELERARELAGDVKLPAERMAEKMGGGLPGGMATAGGATRSTASTAAPGGASGRRYAPPAGSSMAPGAAYWATSGMGYGVSRMAGHMGSGGPGWGLRMTGEAASSGLLAASKGLRSVTSTLSEGATEVAEAAGEVADAGNVLSVLGPKGMAAAVGIQAVAGALDATAAIVSTYMDLASAGVGIQLQHLRGIAALERPVEIARAAGGIDVGLGSEQMTRANKMGFSPEEAAQIQAQYRREIGVRGAAAPDPFQLILSGISPGAVASVLRTGGAGGSHTGTSRELSRATQDIIGLGVTQHLSGTRIDEALMRVSQQGRQFRDRGLFLDKAALVKKGASLMGIGGASQGIRGGPNPLGGYRGLRAAQRLSQVGADAASEFAAPFAGLADAAMYSWAAEQADNPVDMIAKMQEASRDPQKIQQIMLDQLGYGDATKLALIGKGFAADQAKLMAWPPVQGARPDQMMTEEDMDTWVRPHGRGLGQGSTQVYSREFAQEEHKSLKQAASAPYEDNRKLIEATYELQRMLAEFGVSHADLIGQITDLIQSLKRFFEE